jgi:hypothetical protein
VQQQHAKLTHLTDGIPGLIAAVTMLVRAVRHEGLPRAKMHMALLALVHDQRLRKAAGDDGVHPGLRHRIGHLGGVGISAERHEMRGNDRCPCGGMVLYKRAPRL